MNPPYPPDTRAKGYRFELDYERILQSDTWALASMRQRPLLLMAWFVAWQQTPCGSLPDSDELIAARIGMDTAEFQQNRVILLRGWEKADDGRLYHPVVSEMVLEMLARKTRETQRKANYREKMKGQTVPYLSHGTDTGQTRDSTGSDDTGTGTGIKRSKPSCSPSASGPSDDGFATFWEKYPRKISKAAAEKAWKKAKPDLQTVLNTIERAKASTDWQKDKGQFIPYPATWLNDRRWEDEIAGIPSAAECQEQKPKVGDKSTRHGAPVVFHETMGWVPA